MRRRTTSLLLAACLASCGGEDPPATGGFDEMLIDRRVRHGQGIEVVDIDRDGAPDVVAALSLTDAVHVYLNHVVSEARWDLVSVSGPATIVAMDVAVADYDVDGDLDVAAVGLFERRGGAGTPGEIAWYENPGDVRGVWRTRVLAGGEANLYGPRTLDAADLNGDGRPDLIFGAQAGGESVDGRPPPGNGLYWLRNDPGSFSGPYPIDPMIQDVSSVRIADIDGDGALDIAATGNQSRELAWYRNQLADPAPRFVKYLIARNIGGFHDIARADFDGDGRDELAVAIAHTSSTTLRLYGPPAETSGVWSEREIAGEIGEGAGDAPRVTAGDFDGDGRPDLALSTAGPGDLRLYSNQGEAWTRRDIRGGYLGLNFLSSADVDGDGRLDLLSSTYEFATRDRLAWWKNVP